jgi:PDZ domain
MIPRHPSQATACPWGDVLAFRGSPGCRAVSITTAKHVADLLVGEPIETAFVGISGNEPAQGLAEVVVTGISPGSPADTAGIVVGDLITALDGNRVETRIDLAAEARTSPTRRRDCRPSLTGRLDPDVTLEAKVHERRIAERPDGGRELTPWSVSPLWFCSCGLGVESGRPPGGGIEAGPAEAGHNQLSAAGQVRSG